MYRIFVAGMAERLVHKNIKSTVQESVTNECCPSAEFITACILSKLGCKTTLFTKIGELHRNELINRLDKSGIDFSCIRQTNDLLITENDVKKLNLSEYNTLFFTGAFPSASEKTYKTAQTLANIAQQNAMRFVFAPDLSANNLINESEKIALINEFAYVSDVFIPSLNEAQKLSGLNNVTDIGKHYINRGTKKIVIKLGKDGAFFLSKKESGFAPTFRAEPVDETGSGNAFAAGLIYGLCEELPLGEAIFRANALASMQIQYKGDNEYMPTLNELRDYMLERRFVVDGCKEV